MGKEFEAGLMFGRLMAPAMLAMSIRTAGLESFVFKKLQLSS